jgi:Astacin (Peptidase family M12A)
MQIDLAKVKLFKIQLLYSKVCSKLELAYIIYEDCQSFSKGVIKMPGEFRSGSIAGTALVSGVTFARKGLQYAEVDGLAIFEGDIVLGSMEEVRTTADANAGNLPQQGVGISGQQFRWPNATIPYDIDPALPTPQRVTDAIAHWEANTRIRFVLRTPANAAQYPDFVHFQSGGGCSSMVGRRGGQQSITLGNGCSTGNAIHEIGHTVGLWHEQSREDRDTFVRIVFVNIDPTLSHNFAQHITDGDDLGGYDYGSIMHYPSDAFSINGQPTIELLQPLPPGVVIGQRNGLSQGDIAAVHAMYPASPTIKEAAKDPISDTTFKEIRKDPIQDTIKEVRKDPISDTTFKEIRKDPIQDTIKEVRKDPIQDTIKEVSRDPIGGGGTLVENVTVPVQPIGFGSIPSATPFIMATPSRVGSGNADVFAEAAAQVQELAEVIVVTEQQLSELMVAYEAALQTLNIMQQGQG